VVERRREKRENVISRQWREFTLGGMTAFVFQFVMFLMGMLRDFYPDYHCFSAIFMNFPGFLRL
jgi:hypothetical protein